MEVRVLDAAGRVRSGTTTEDGAIEVGDERLERQSVTFLPPSQPTKVICLARNVASHAAEHDAAVPERPEYFFKPPSALAAHAGTVTIPAAIESVEYEAELAAVIGSPARGVEQTNAMDHVRGLTCLNDLSNRADQRSEINWVRGKGFDGAAPTGPGIVEPAAVPDDASIELYIDGELEQSGRRDEYEFDLAEAIAEVSQYLTLEPGDVIALGTTAGVGPVPDGALVELSIEGVPTLRHRVVYQG